MTAIASTLRQTATQTWVITLRLRDSMSRKVQTASTNQVAIINRIEAPMIDSL